MTSVIAPRSPVRLRPVGNAVAFVRPGGTPGERAGRRLDVAARGLHSAAEELLDTADELIRLAARRIDACPVPSGACPEHRATLRSTAGSCWCTHPRLSPPVVPQPT
jgi:hypothetical protein